ncbi:MAG: phage tail family protein [Bacillota bacterium]|nr:phage tail family protein [Bacillota bacterium]
MQVNAIDISNFKAKLLKKDIQTAEVIIYDDWLRNALNPLFMGKKEKYKQIKIQLKIKDIDDENALNNISNFIKQLEKSTIKFDELSFYFDCTIGSKSQERKAKGKYILDVELKSGYAYKSTVTETMNHVSSKTINVSGNLDTPAILTVTVPSDTTSLTITGFGDSITLKNLKANIPVVVSGEDCTVLQDSSNKFGDTDMWDFPVLQPGSNTITVNIANCTISISYKPRWT